MADYIADYLLDCLQLIDENARAGFEVMVAENTIFVSGEYHCKKKLPRTFFKAKVAEAVADITHPDLVTEYRVVAEVSKQSPKISQKCLGAQLLCPDQGVAWGYASRETATLMPLSHEVGQKLLRSILDITEENPRVSPDFKLLVIAEEGQITSITCSIKHAPDMSVEEVRNLVYSEGIEPFMGEIMAERDSVTVNKGGEFPMGIHSDSGVTNRKIMADSYGCNIEHGGGGFSGKDLTKPDRLLSYYARYIAVNVVATGLTSYCKVKLVYFYAEERVKVVDIITNKDNFHLNEAVEEVFADSYSSIYNKFKDFRGFSFLAKYGHFGCSRQDSRAPWEEADMAEKILQVYRKYELG